MLRNQKSDLTTLRPRGRAPTVLAAMCLIVPLSVMMSSPALAQHPSSHDRVSNTVVQPLSNADLNPGGANNGGHCGAYCSTRDGSPSLNGNGGGKSTGRPCAGCVGRADNKNPPGQAPDGSDHNKGYECDANHGIGRTNPAHTGCKTSAIVCVPPSVNTNGLCVPPKDCKGVTNGTATSADCVFTGGGGTISGVTVVPAVETVIAPSQLTLGAVAVTITPQVGLPFTGSDVTVQVVAALLLLLTGMAMVMAVRKPQLLGTTRE